MDTAQILVTVAGAGLIAAVLVFFFGRRSARRSSRR
jgi:LPXTG-motif cell wall-anchored protein